MPDMEKVLNGLECHVLLECHNCPYVDAFHPGWGCHLEELIADAFNLLREQEPVEPKVEIDTWVCGNCGTPLERQSMVGENAVLSEQFDYCPSCGKPVKWE